MNKTLLVSLVSDQTIPNVQLIKEFQSKVTDYLFITTKGMEEKGTRQWIEETCQIKGTKIVVKQFSFFEIENELKNFDFDLFEKIIVNLSGGTKIMTLVASDFFKNLAANIYYVTGTNNEYVQLFPLKKDNTKQFTNQIQLSEYLKSYGFEIQKSELSGISIKQTKRIFQIFCNNDILKFKDSLKLINNSRAKGIKKEEDFRKISSYLELIDFKPQRENVLSISETKYLSGDWFEEYIGLTIKDELNLTDDNLFISTVLTKQPSQTQKNSVKELLGEEDDDEKTKNEMDIMFMYNNKFFSIECKSSIIAYKTVKKGQEPIEKAYNILGETIYKSDSLKSKFGLFPQTTIITLTDFKEYCDCKDTSERNNKTKEMKGLISRANLSNIKLIDKSMLTLSSSIYNLIK